MRVLGYSLAHCWVGGLQLVLGLCLTFSSKVLADEGDGTARRDLPQMPAVHSVASIEWRSARGAGFQPVGTGEGEVSGGSETGETPLTHSNMGRMPMARSNMGETPMPRPDMGRMPMLRSDAGETPMPHAGQSEIDHLLKDLSWNGDAAPAPANEPAQAASPQVVRVYRVSGEVQLTAARTSRSDSPAYALKVSVDKNQVLLHGDHVSTPYSIVGRRMIYQAAGSNADLQMMAPGITAVRFENGRTEIVTLTPKRLTILRSLSAMEGYALVTADFEQEEPLSTSDGGKRFVAAESMEPTKQFPPSQNSSR